MGRKWAAGASVLGAIWLAAIGLSRAPLEAAQSAVPLASASQRATFKQYCVTCHNERLPKAGTGPSALDEEALWEIGAQFVSTLIYPLLYCALTVAYYDLRVRKEGFDLELLESTLAHALPSGGPADLRESPKPPSY